MSCIKNYAPIMVSVYNREVHFRNCIESLKDCYHAKESHLFIAIDAPYREEDVEANSRIIEYSKKISGFKEVTLFIRSKNLGAHENRSLARKDIFAMYDRLIMFEDDNVFSKDFLHFLNIGLEKYKDNKEIYSVSGYNYPMEIPSTYTENVYIWQGYSAWGVGVWRDRMAALESDTSIALAQIRKFLKNLWAVQKLNRLCNNYLPALLLMLQVGKIHGDGYVSLHLFRNKMYTVFPVVTRVRNTGHDGSGIIGAMENDIYSKQEVYNGDLNYTFPDDIKPNKNIQQIVSGQSKRSVNVQVKNFIKVLLTNLGVINRSKIN